MTRSRRSDRYAVIAALAASPAHGYALHERLSRAFGSAWKIAQSQLYAVLARLEEEGLIEAIGEERVPGRPPRRVFAATEGAREEAVRWATRPCPRTRDLRVEVPVKVWVLRQLSVDGVHAFLEAQHSTLEALRARLRAQGWVHCADPVLRAMIADYRESQTAMLAAWVARWAQRTHKEETHEDG